MSLYSTYFGTISVKDPTYGAKGDGTTDDTAAIQAAFNVAFGPISAPHGQSNGKLNFAVFFPPGVYLITSPLYIADMVGGLLLGAGNGVSQLLWHPTNGAAIPGGGTYTGGGNSLIGDTQTPCICTDGCIQWGIENLSISGPSTPAATIVGVYIATSGSHGQATGSTFVNINFASLGVGILSGGGNGNGCDNGCVINVNFKSCTLAGLRLFSANAVNWNVYGGGADNCATLSTFSPSGATSGNCGAAYSVPSGNISTISAVSVSSNLWDFAVSGSGGMAIIGGSSESINCLGNANCAISMTGFNYRNGIAGGGVWIDTQLGSSVIASGCNFNSVSVSVDSIANLGNSGIVTFDNCVFGLQGAASGIHGTAGAKLYIRGALFGGTYSSFLTAYTGTVGQNI